MKKSLYQMLSLYFLSFAMVFNSVAEKAKSNDPRFFVVQAATEKYTQFQSNPSRDSEERYYEELGFEQSAKLEIKKRLKSFRQMPQVRQKGISFEILDTRSRVAASFSPLKDGSFLVQFKKKQFIWTPGVSDLENFQSLEKALGGKDSKLQSFFENLDFGISKAHAGTLGTVLAVVIVAAVCVGLYKLYKSANKAIKNTSNAAERNLDRVGGSVSSGVRRITDAAAERIEDSGPQVNRAAGAVEQAARDVSASNASLSGGSTVNSVNDGH